MLVLPSNWRGRRPAYCLARMAVERQPEAPLPNSRRPHAFAGWTLIGQRCREAPIKQLTGSLLGPRELARFGWKNTAADGSAPPKARSSRTDSNSARCGSASAVVVLVSFARCDGRRNPVSFACLSHALCPSGSFTVPSRRRCFAFVSWLLFGRDA
jgi:hypothetical protein